MTDTDNQFDDVQDDFDEVEELTETDAGRHSDEFQQASSAAPRPAQPNRGPHKSSTQVAAEVWAGKWGDDDWQDKVEAAGYNAELIDDLVSRGVGRRGQSDSDRPTTFASN